MPCGARFGAGLAIEALPIGTIAPRSLGAFHCSLGGMPSVAFWLHDASVTRKTITQ